LKYILTPVAKDFGYDTPVRADKITAPGVITEQVIEHILNDNLVIADLSERNANVFYELAIRHVSKKPLIQMIATSEKLPFDVGMMRTIRFDIRDLDSVDPTKEELAKQIQHLHDHPDDDTASPLSKFLDLLVLKGSNKPEDRAIGEVLGEIAHLKSISLDIQSRVTGSPFAGMTWYTPEILAGLPVAPGLTELSDLSSFVGGAWKAHPGASGE
jgi:hypothetical protein